MQDAVFEQLLAIFRDEAHEELDELRQLVGSLSDSNGPRFDESIVRAMRISHNLKGASCSVGLDDMSGLAHVLEDVLLALRDGTVVATRQVALEVMSRCVSTMERIVDAVAVDAAAMLEELKGLTPHLADGDETSCVRQDVGTPEVETIQSHPSEDAALEPLTADDTPAAPSAAGGNIGARQHGIRVDVDRLDELVRHAGELLATHAETQQRYWSLEELQQDLKTQFDELAPEARGPILNWLDRLDTTVKQHRDDLRRLTRLTSELTEAIRRMRMVPVAALAATFRRCVADAAQVTHRQAELQLVGGDVELDKQVLDRIVEPMLHLLRNAVDHGIEEPDRRAQLGKPRRGRVLITARLDGDSVELSVHDDGRGIDTGRVREAALSRGLRTKDHLEAMTETELCDLMFEPGFSTAQQVSKISGRGLGLDVVRRAAEECGGRLELLASGRLGGASFLLLLPVNVLSVHALMVRAGGGAYAIPIDAVERTMRFTRSELRSTGRDSILDVEGQPMRLIELSSALGTRSNHVPAHTRDDGTAIILRRGGRVLAVEVDEVIGDEEYAIKRLPWNLRSVRGVAGVVALPKSQVALALDTGHLLRTAGDVARVDTSTQQKTRILVVDDSLTARTLAKNALVAAGYAVTAVVDGAKAWQALLDENYALLVSDVRMPNLDGIELTRRVRSHDRLHSLPVVLVTTESTPHDIQRGLSAGADEYVIKGPMQQQKLLEAVARHV